MGAWHFGVIVWGEGLQGCCLGQARLCTTSPSALTRCHCPGCGSQRLLRCRSHPAGRGPNSSSLFPPLAAVVAVAPCRGGFGIAENFSSSPEAPLLGELSNEVRLRGCTKTEPFLCRKVRLVASFPVSFWRSLWYTCFAALPAHFIGKGVSTMSPFLSLIQSVVVNIISHCVCKWLDGLSTGRKH